MQARRQGCVAGKSLHDERVLTDKVSAEEESEDAWAKHCREVDIATMPLRDCLSYYNGHGEAAPGSLAYYGGGQWHKWRKQAQESMAPYLFESRRAHPTAAIGQ